MFSAALFKIAKTWKHPKCPLTEEWIKKMQHIYTMEYYSAIKKNELMPSVAMWMDLEISVISEFRKKNTRYHLYVESFKIIQINLITKQKETHKHRK